MNIIVLILTLQLYKFEHDLETGADHLGNELFMAVFSRWLQSSNSLNSVDHIVFTSSTGSSVHFVYASCHL